MTSTGFTPPNQRTRQLAIGATKAGDQKLKAFLKGAEESGLFAPVNPPRPSDWLGTYKEPGQPAASYINSLSRYRPVSVNLSLIHQN